MLKDVGTYQIMDPAELGLAMTLPLGKHSGRHAFARACHAAGLSLVPEEIDAGFRRFKELADSGAPVSIHDVFQEVRA
jgi:2-isopropylmalate synthase